MFQNSKTVKGSVMTVSGAAVKECGGTWVGVEERRKREGRGTPDFLLEIIYHAAPAQNLMKSSHWTPPN